MKPVLYEDSADPKTSAKSTIEAKQGDHNITTSCKFHKLSYLNTT